MENNPHCSLDLVEQDISHMAADVILTLVLVGVCTSLCACTHLDVFHIPPSCGMLGRQTSLPCWHFIFILALCLRHVCLFNLIAAVICSQLIDFTQHCLSPTLMVRGCLISYMLLSSPWKPVLSLCALLTREYRSGAAYSHVISWENQSWPEFFCHSSCCHSKPRGLLW